VVIDRESQERADHRVIGAEGRKPFAGADGEMDCVVLAEQIVCRDDELVEVGVRVAAVHESFAPVTQGKLSVGDGEALEVEPRHQSQPAPRPRVHCDRGLDDTYFAEGPTARHMVRSLEREDCLRAHAGPHWGLGAGGRRKEARDQHQGDTDAAQSDSAPAAASETRLARMKSRFIMVIVSMLICLGQAS
jgi:hypothetical protein